LALTIWFVAWLFVYKKLHQKLWFLVALVFLLFGIWGLVNMPPVQNFLVNQVTGVLSNKLKTKVAVKHVDFSLFNKMLIQGILVEDRQKDTLLYTGEAKVNITDWFFIKEKATLQYLGLSNTIVNLKRTDSVWNYQFIIDFFAAPKSTTPSGKKGLEFNCKQVDIQNIRFAKIDKWVGQDMIITVGKANILVDSMSFDKKFFAINNIALDQPYFSQSNYTGNRPKRTTSPKTNTTTEIPPQFKWNNAGWIMHVNNITLNNGSFKNDKETERLPYTDRFDGQHLLFAAINGGLKNIHFAQDTVWADATLSTKEQSGFTVKKLQSRIKFTPDIMEFNNLDLQTNSSRLGNYYAMKYNDFNSDMSDFIHSVMLEGRFINSSVTSNDIAFFAPALKSWNRTFDIKGNAKGTIDNLITKNMLIKSGNTLIDGDIALRGLPDLNETFIDFKSNNLVTNYADLTSLVPALKKVTQPDLYKLGNISFKGNYTGFINDFVTYGTLNTNMGTVIADINMKLLPTQPATYSGKISSQGFKLGQFIKSPLLGSVALDGNVKGSGFTLKDLKANFKGNIRQLEFSGYNYNNIVVDGEFNKKVFSGNGSVNDPNLQIENFKGSIDLTNATPAFNFDARLRKASFKKLRLANEEFDLTGRFNLNFSGNTIDNFLGTARVYDATLQHNNTKLSFDSLTLRSYIDDNKKRLSFQSNEFEGYVNGNFKILELPDAFKVFLSRYYPAYIKTPKYKLSNQDFNFLIKTKNADEYIQLIDKRLKGFNDATFSGNLNLAQNELNVNATVPAFEYDGKLFNNVVLQSNGNLDTLITKVTTGDIVLNDSLHFPGTDLLIKSHNDLSAISLKTSASKTLSEAELNATVKTLSDGVTIHFSPSSFIVNDKKWQLEKDGELTIRKSYIDASEVKFVQGNQEIIFATEMEEDGTDNVAVVAKLKKVNINDFTPLFLKNPRLEGVVTGSVTLHNPFGKQTIDFDAEADNFTIDDRMIGKTKLGGKVDVTTGIIGFNANTDNELNKFSIAGKYNTKDTSGTPLNLDFLAERFDLGILNNYLGTIFTDMQGNAASALKMSYGKNGKFLTGNVTVTEGSLKVNYTQCRYKFTNETIIFNPDEMDLGTLRLTDTLGNAGTLSGKMYHKLFQEFDFDNLRFETPNMLLLNTTAKDNSQFYGNVIGNAVMTLNGPLSNLRMKIDGAPSTKDSSHIYLPTGDSRETGPIDYIDFVQFGTKMEDIKARQGTNFFIDMDIKANPACKVDVILDEATGDIIKGQGNGNLNIKLGTREPLTMNGQYDITQGEYKFNFQTILNRYFNISKGTITWNGDPYQARINIDANYTAPGIDLGNLSFGTNKVQQKANVFIIAHLTETLQAPAISFEFQLPKENEYAKDPFIVEKLKSFERDKNEMNRQVASVLLFNTFINDNGGGIGGSGVSLISGTVGQLLSSYLNNQLTKFFQRIFKDPSITPYLTFNSNYDITNPELIRALQASGNVGVRIEKLGGRLIVLIGGNVDYNNPYILQARNTNVLLTPDITVEYILSKNGMLRIVGFKKSSFDATQGQRNRTGLRLSYQKEFDRKKYRNSALRRKEEDAEKPIVPQDGN
jgi:hypothetical protein